MTYQKILITYYSRSGHCRRVAEEISRKLNCDVQGIYTQTDYPLGFWGFQKALFDTAVNRNIAIDIGKRDLNDYDLVLVGSPIWFGRMAQPVRVFLKKYRGEIRNIGFFCTQDGNSGAEKVFHQMSQLSGKSPAVTFRVSSAEIRNETFRKKVAQFVELFKPIPQKKSEPLPPPESHAPMI